MTESLRQSVLMFSPLIFFFFNYLGPGLLMVSKSKGTPRAADALAGDASDNISKKSIPTTSTTAAAAAAVSNKKQQADAMVMFPRGGQPLLTPLELKNIQESVSNEVKVNAGNMRHFQFIYSHSSSIRILMSLIWILVVVMVVGRLSLQGRLNGKSLSRKTTPPIPPLQTLTSVKKLAIMVATAPMENPLSGKSL